MEGERQSPLLEEDDLEATEGLDPDGDLVFEDDFEDFENDFEDEGDEDLPEDEPEEPTEPLGPRRAALREKRKRQRVRTLLLGAGAAALAVFVVMLGSVLLGGDDPAETPSAGVPPDVVPADTVTNTLVVGTLEEEGSGALWLAVVTHNAGEDKGSVLYIPAHTAVEIPGRGLHGIGDSFLNGDMALMLVSVENLLGISVDRYVEISDRDARVLFDGIGPVSVDVPSEVRVPAGREQSRIIFTEGPQRLAPQFVVDLLYTIGEDGDDEELGARHLAFWHGLFELFAEDPGALRKAVTAGGAALGESDAEPEDHAQLLAQLASLPDGALLYEILPVRQVSVGGDELYEVDDDEIARIVQDHLGGPSSGEPEVRVQILNGNGIPGIGQDVAEMLVGNGFRVILSGNAQRLNYRKTLIVAYDSSPEGQAVAERARELLGVGTVQVSAQRQGIVDLTIVVGKDIKDALIDD